MQYEHTYYRIYRKNVLMVILNQLVSRWGKGAMGQWKFQDPKMEVLYHIRPYFVGIFPDIGLT